MKRRFCFGEFQISQKNVKDRQKKKKTGKIRCITRRTRLGEEKTCSLYMPARELDGIEVVVGIFWKVLELKKLLLSV